MIVFNNDMEMLRELDDFMYKCKGFNSVMRNDLVDKLNMFLKYWELDGDIHNFIDMEKVRS